VNPLKNIKKNLDNVDKTYKSTFSRILARDRIISGYFAIVSIIVMAVITFFSFLTNGCLKEQDKIQRLYISDSTRNNSNTDSLLEEIIKEKYKK